ncbi:hypothetical protein KI387_003936, partial [Taxus chinensis]
IFSNSPDQRRKEQALRKCEKSCRRQAQARKNHEKWLSPCPRTMWDIWDAKARIGRKACRRPSSKRTSGTRVREGPKLASSPETEICSTGTVGPEGRVGREKLIRPKEEEKRLTAKWDSSGTRT